MEFLHVIKPLYSASGFAVGMLVGMTGVGGGSLMTPLLILLFGVHPATAVGTDLFYAAATKTGGTLFHGFGKTVDWRIVGLLACGSVPATIIVLTTLYHFNINSAAASKALTHALSIALFIAAFTLAFRDMILRLGAARVGELSVRNTAAFTVAIGALLGVMVSVTSVGAGALGVTVLLFLYPKLPVVRIVGSDIAHAVPLTLCAGIGHWLNGSVDWAILGSLLVGSLPGIFLGSYVSRRSPEKVLRLILAATLCLVGYRLLTS
jgi:uncharacterized membrane protein YfcA